MKINKFKNVRNFNIQKDNIIIIDKSFSVRTNKCFVKIDNASDIYAKDNYIIIVEDYYGKGYLVDNNCNISNFLNHTYSISKMSENYVLLYKDEGDSTTYGVYDLIQNKLLFTEDHYLGRDIISDYLVGFWNSSIFFRNIRNGELIWEYSLSDFPNYLDSFHNELPMDVQQIAGIYNSFLWIHLGGDRLIALDIYTGELKHHLENIPKSLYGNNHLNSKEGIIQILHYHKYLEFDLNTLTLLEKYENKNFFFRNSNYYQNDSNLYFCGVKNWPNEDWPNSFGIFDTKKLKVTWLEEQKENEGKFFNPPLVNEKQLAILDDMDNLLVFDISGNV